MFKSSSSLHNLPCFWAHLFPFWYTLMVNTTTIFQLLIVWKLRTPFTSINWFFLLCKDNQFFAASFAGIWIHIEHGDRNCIDDTWNKTHLKIAWKVGDLFHFFFFADAVWWSIDLLRYAVIDVVLMSLWYYPVAIARAIADEQLGCPLSVIVSKTAVPLQPVLDPHHCPLTYSMADKSPNIDTRRIIQRKPIHILALDGGGIRGLSSLISLCGLMERMAVTEDTSSHKPATVWPSEYFDPIIGTETGGICVLFLGLLQMRLSLRTKKWPTLLFNHPIHCCRFPRFHSHVLLGLHYYHKR